MKIINNNHIDSSVTWSSSFICNIAQINLLLFPMKSIENPSPTISVVKEINSLEFP